MVISRLILEKNKGKWIAIDHSFKKVISSGTNAKVVLLKAKKAGHSEPILFKVPLFSEAGYVGTQV